MTANKTSVTLGDFIKLSCNSGGNPDRLSYSWRKDGKVLNLPSTVTSGHVIEVTSLNYSGHYACVVSNIAGVKENGIDITVNCKCHA